jgi:hypothetical protein
MRAPWHALHMKLLAQTARFGHHHRFRELAAAHPALAGFADTAALLDHQHRSVATPEAKDAVLRALVIGAQDTASAPETAQTLLLLALWPGLDAVRGRLARFYPGAGADLAGDIVASCLATMGNMDLACVNRVAATLLRNLERDLVQTIVRDQSRATAPICIGSCDDGDGEMALAADLPRAEAALDGRRLPQHLQRLIGADAGLVFAVVVAGFSQATSVWRWGSVMTRPASAISGRSDGSGLRQNLSERGMSHLARTNGVSHLNGRPSERGAFGRRR